MQDINTARKEPKTERVVAVDSFFAIILIFSFFIIIIFFILNNTLLHIYIQKKKLQKLLKKLAKSSKITIYESDLNLSKITI